MPRVLMLAHWFPPCERWPTAARRAEGFAQHLKGFGWDPIVVAPDLDAHGLCNCGANHAAELPGLDVRRLALRPALSSWLAGSSAASGETSGGTPRTTRSVKASLRSAFESRGRWLVDATRALEDIIASEEVDALWTTSGPSSSAVVGHRVAKRHHLPWVADLRDPISSTIVATDAHPAVQAAVRRVGAMRSLRHADAVVAASQGSADLDAAALGRSVVTIPSGIDIADLPPAGDGTGNPDGPLTLVGALYPDAMDVQVVVEGLALLARGQTPKRLAYYGPHGDILLAAARAAGAQDAVDDHGMVPTAVMYDAIMSSRAVVLLEYTTGGTRVPGKVYELSALRVPVIIVPGRNDEIMRILRDTTHAVEAGSATAFASRATDLSWAGALPPAGAFRVTRRAGAQGLAAVLDDVMAS